MKEWLNKIKGSKGGPWFLLLLLLGTALLLSPLSADHSHPMTDEEKRISATLSSIAGAGESRISIYYAQSGNSFDTSGRTPLGAVIISQGANDIAVKLQLLRAVETLLQLPADHIEVFPMEEIK